MSKPSKRAEPEGERDLGNLLRTMNPVLREPVYLFATLPPATVLPEGLCPLLQFQEVEGLTVVVERDAAHAARIEGVFPCRQITLEVHSALDGVGFLAAVTACLAEAGISGNAVAGFYHDHLFVPQDRAEAAVRALQALADRQAVGAG